MKENIVPKGVDAATGLMLYEFSYINGDGARYVGVMADEVAQVMPEAVIDLPNGMQAVNYRALGLEMKEVTQ